MCPIRPLDEHGRWGNKQRREYLLNEQGERIRDEVGNYVFNAVPTTDWGSPDTLEHWRQAWADLCNQNAEKKLDCRIDHRSYERQGIDQLPTVHEGVTFREMEAKGIRTDKGDLNRFIRKTNALLRAAKEKIAALIGWLKDVKAELAKPQPPTLNDLLALHCANRNKGAYSNKAKNANLQRYAEAFSFLQSKKLYQAEKRLGELDRLFIRIYEDNVAGRITDEKFSMMSKPTRTNRHSLKRKFRLCSRKSKYRNDRLKLGAVYPAGTQIRGLGRAYPLCAAETCQGDLH